MRDRTKTRWQNERVDARERKEILGQWGVRDENARERRERKALERSLQGAPYRGRAVRPQRNFFTPSPESYVTSLGGPLPYMVRLREIEAETRGHERALAEAWRELADQCAGDEAAFEHRWLRIALRWNFAAVNDLIDRHNRFYPAEARLPMDPRTRDFALVNGEPYRRDRLDREWILARFPATLAIALAA